MDPISLGANAFWTTVISAANAYALNVVTSKLFAPKQKSYSPTYTFAKTQASSNLPVPIIYGKKVKAWGNKIWQTEGSVIYAIVGFGQGKIKGFSNVMINNIPIGELPGCSYTAYLGDGVQEIDSRVPGDTQREKALIVGGLKYDAYLALTITASDKVNNDFNVSAEVDGKIVRIYSNTTTYTEDSSENPIWNLLDFYTNKNAAGMNQSRLMLQTFINEAAYCDELVSGQKRFTMNLSLDERRSRGDWVAEMMATCRCHQLYQNGKYGVFIEKPTEVSQSFTTKKTESFRIFYSKNGEIYDKINIRFIDPTNEWTKVPAPAEIPRSQRKVKSRTKPNVLNVDVFGITNFNQASRQAWYYVNESQNTLWAEYRTNRKASNRVAMDVVAITDHVFQYVGKKWWVRETGFDENGYVVLILKEYNENLYVDALGSVAPTVNITNLANPFSKPQSLDYFRVSISGSNVIFNWQRTGGMPSTAKGYEIRRGDTFSSGQFVAKVSGKNTDQASLPAMVGDTVYHIAAFNDAGYSDAISDSISIDVIPDKVGVTEALDYHMGSTITGNGLLVGDDIIQFSSYTYADIKNKTFVELKTVNLFNGGGSGVTITGGVIDIGKVASITVVVNEKWRLAPDQPVIYKIQTSLDGTVFSDWKLLPTGQMNTRYFKLRGTTNGVSRIGVLDSLSVKASTDRLTLNFIDIVIPIGGANIAFNPAFKEKPSIIVSPNGTALKKFKKSNESGSGCKIQLYDDTGVEVSGTADVVAVGF